MNKLCMLTRNLKIRITFLQLNARIVQLSSSSSDDEEKSQRKLNEKKKSEDALNKLNNLLKTMIEEDVVNSKTKLNLAKPISKRKKDVEKKAEPVKIESHEKQVVNAVQNVARSLGGDVKQTESELLMKLLNPTNGDKTTASTNLSDIVKGMKVDHEGTKSNEISRAAQVKQLLQHSERPNLATRENKGQFRSQIPELPVEKIDLFGSEPLGIFKDQTDATEGVENKTWAKLHEKELKLAVTHPPGNYFQQMILWTEQGKVWKFPINNEQGLEEEQNVYFAEHVFLEKHLEPWCPSKGPIRHFMELVCVGLSKNPYLTVEAKKEHIEWFKNYFEDKKQLLREVGAFQDHDSGDRNKPKQIGQ